MPRRDGTGPMGIGAKTGRGMGFCNVATKAVRTIGGLGLGLGYRRGFKRKSGVNNFNNMINFKNQKDLLTYQKDILEQRLDLIKDQLNAVQEDK
ncbi:DUF5320 domain-containing protein [Clostridium sporogenes]|uniref:DUF5320 domain-containing protein n=1 Tax=Clostridium sporogenes TaxID=1509 RepID=UPI0006B2A71C|nr:DUF5320 domain-containing protein [Clostridium sporogenes]KOY67411.1 hypothetical protein AN649_03245 [Clostridium sporogenes]MDU1421152.1 DUF5320 domain-containing protein [Clostridium botulinum]